MWDKTREWVAYTVYPEARTYIQELIRAKAGVIGLLSEAERKISEITEELDNLKDVHLTMVGYKQKHINWLTTENSGLLTQLANRKLTYKEIIDKPVCKIHYTAFSVVANKIVRPIVVDVKGFIDSRDSLVLDGIKDNISVTMDMTASEKAWLAMKYIYEKFRYVSDLSQFGYNEYWQYPYETMQLGLGDCEDSSLLLCTILRIFGVEAYVHVGLVPQGGHAWCSFLDEQGSLRLLESTWHRQGTENFEDVWPMSKSFDLMNAKPEYRTAACFNEQGCWNIDPLVWNLASQEETPVKITDPLELV
jgi:hypothetical protein